MSPRKQKAVRKLRGAQKWIMDELRNIPPSTALSTSKIAKKISKASGKSYHKNSVYLALRLLTRRGEVRAVRRGTEKTYRLASDSGAPASLPTPASASASTAAEATGTSPHLTWPERVAHDAMLPHKLALGEILVLSVSNGHVLAATNLHGRLVFERYPL